LRAADESLNQN